MMSEMWSDERIIAEAEDSMSEPTLEFWKNMALSLKDELVERGNRIAAQNAELVEQQIYILQLEREVSRLTAELAEGGLWEPMPADKMLKLSSRGVGQPSSGNHYIVTRNRVAGRELPNGWAVCRSLRDRLPSSSTGMSAEGEGA